MGEQDFNVTNLSSELFKILHFPRWLRSVGLAQALPLDTLTNSLRQNKTKGTCNKKKSHIVTIAMQLIVLYYASFYLSSLFRRSADFLCEAVVRAKLMHTRNASAVKVTVLTQIESRSV